MMGVAASSVSENPPAAPEYTDAEKVQIRAFDYWCEVGFTPAEALALVADGLSVSEHREFLRHHPGCSARDAVAILL